MNDQLKADLISLKGDLILFKPSIREVSNDIIREGYSKYPIFIAHRIDVPVGEVILDHQELAMTWSISASTLEEFEQNNLVTPDKKALFIQNYKDPETHICVFLISDAGANFVFVPYDINPFEGQEEIS